MDDGSAVEDKQWTKQSLQTLKKKVESLKGLDHQIIELHGNLEVGDVEARTEKEIGDSDGVREEINVLILRLEEVLIPTGATSPQQMNVVAQ